MAAKIKFENWKASVKIEKTPAGYRIDEGFGWCQTTSQHGKSMGEVSCPCCGEVNDIYLWSFRGSGKRCENCNVMLGSMGAFIAKKEITKDVLVNDTHIVKINKKQ